MICYNCQKEILEGSRYCYHCGAAQKPLNPPPAPAKPLRRLRRNKVLAGVCAGLAEHFGLDITIVRLVWVLVTILTIFPGIVAYLICWIVVPYAQDESGSPVPVAR